MNKLPESLDTPSFRLLVDEHRQWLAPFNPQYLKNWEKNLRDKSTAESALAEAGVRRLLQGYGVQIEPNEDLTFAERRPDFRCTVGKYKFYVEVTCITSEKATKVTKLVDDVTGPYGPLDDDIFAKCIKKAEQCRNQDCPTLVAVATFHMSASVLCFARHHVERLLTGETSIICNLNMETGEMIGDAYQTTQQKSAAFLWPISGTEDPKPARRSISGLLFCGLGCEPPVVRGILHPRPDRQFDPSVLPTVDFGRVHHDRDQDKLYVSWPDGEKD